MTATDTSSSHLTWYLERIKSTPLLTAKQERQLSRRVREHSDPIAREVMIQANLLLVVKIAKEYSSAGMTLGDLIAEGNLGLMRAVEEFDPDQGVRFSTYASWWIKQAIKKALINAGQSIHIPDYLAKLITKWRRISHKLRAELGRPPSMSEIADHMKINHKKAGVIQQGLSAVKTPTQFSNEEAFILAEMLADTNTDAPDQHMLDRSVGPIIQAFLERLDPRSRQILVLRYALDGHNGQPRTYREIGKIIGLTRERIRQLEKIALTELKEIIDEII